MPSASLAWLLTSGAHDVVFNCGACKHMVHRTPEELVVAYGESTTLEQIEKRGRCTACGAKGRLWLEVLSPPSGRGGFRNLPS